MIKFLDGASVTNELREQIRCSKTVRFAVAFWGKGAADDLGLLAKGKAATVVCNLRSGGTNPNGIRPMIEAGVAVSQCDVLHGKVYLFDKAVVIGSSNASANGLSLQGAEVSDWHEANVVTDDPETLDAANAWFDTIPQGPISEDDLKAAEEAWSRRRRSDSSELRNASTPTLIEALRQAPQKFADRRIYLCVFREWMSQDGEAALESGLAFATVAGPEEISGFENWLTLPDDADLVSFYVGPRGGVTFDGFWEMPRERTVVTVNDANVIFCRKKSQIRGVSNVGNLKDWKKALVSFARKCCEVDGAYIDLGEFAKKYLGRS
jgi:hypothetical protein